jgi:hypothetical protein
MIAARGVAIDPGTKHTSEAWQYYIVNRGDTTMQLQIYYTSSDINDHDPILARKTINTGLMPCIKAWGDPLTITLPDLRAMGFKPRNYTPKNQKPRTGLTEIYYRVVLECTGADMVVTWQLAAPNSQPFDSKYPHDANTATLKTKSC